MRKISKLVSFILMIGLFMTISVQALSQSRTPPDDSLLEIKTKNKVTFWQLKPSDFVKSYNFYDDLYNSDNDLAATKIKKYNKNSNSNIKLSDFHSIRILVTKDGYIRKITNRLKWGEENSDAIGGFSLSVLPMILVMTQGDVDQAVKISNEFFQENPVANDDSTEVISKIVVNDVLYKLTFNFDYLDFSMQPRALKSN